MASCTQVWSSGFGRSLGRGRARGIVSRTQRTESAGPPSSRDPRPARAPHPSVGPLCCVGPVVCALWSQAGPRAVGPDASSALPWLCGPGFRRPRRGLAGRALVPLNGVLRALRPGPLAASTAPRLSPGSQQTGGQHSPPTGVPLRPSRMKRLARAHPRPVTAARGRPSAPLHALSSRTLLCPRCCLSSCRGWRGCSLVTGPGPWCAVAQHREGRPRSRPPSPPPRRPCPPRFARRGNRVWLHSCLPGSRASS